MEELEILNIAINETSKKIDKNREVDIVGYLQTGNAQVFTREKGVRQSVETIPFENMKKAVKIALIDETIGYLGAPQQFDRKNEVITLIENWIRWKYITESEADFNKVYEFIIKNNYDNKIIASILAEADHKYYWAKLQLQRKHLPESLTCELIDLLESEKEKLLVPILNNRF